MKFQFTIAIAIFAALNYANETYTDGGSQAAISSHKK